MLLKTSLALQDFFSLLIAIRDIASIFLKKPCRRAKIKGSWVRMGEEHRKASTFVTLKSLMKTIKGNTCKGGSV